ncbi:MAG: ABC transporter substrate-binding protein [Sulfurimonas sp.]|jgi:phospholipid transport system substrate-binding protein|nr:ABC transporter substrate-binding protein [Sulfurimonadaceae bacterium]
MFRVVLFLMMFAFSSSLFALEKSEIESQMNQKIQEVLGILRVDGATTEQKGKEIVEIMDEVFDFDLMAKIALGKNAWNSIDRSKQDEFSKVFEQKLKDSYIEKLELYNNQTIDILSLEPNGKNRLLLKTLIRGKDDNYEVNYNFYDKNGDWLIYDVDLVGVSIIQTYRAQFADALKQKSFEDMFAEFRK